MSNNGLYRKSKLDPNQISWKDIFSEFRLPHSKKDMEYTLTAGMGSNTATEKNMLSKWRKPWLFWRMLLGGGGVIAVIYLAYFTCYYEIGILPKTLSYLTFIVPPLITPFILLVFFWELNIPRNISVLELLSYLAVGTLLTTIASSAIWTVVRGDMPMEIAIREEGAKLIAALSILLFLSAKGTKRIYGVTGLIIGAAVGSGFGGIESVEYAFKYGLNSNTQLVHVQVNRAILALGGHTLYAAPYTAAIALHMKKGKFTPESILNRDFLITFVASSVIHAWWDASFMDELGLAKYAFLIVLLWCVTLYILRECLHEVVSIGIARQQHERQKNGHEKKHSQLRATCQQTGQRWDSAAGGGNSALVGIGHNCTLSLTGVSGVSREHCIIGLTPSGWAVEDRHSTNGTWMVRNSSKPVRLKSGEKYPLENSSILFLGSKKCTIRIEIY